MNIHSYEKFWLLASMVLIVGFILTITYGAVGLGIAMVDDSEDTIDPETLTEHPDFSDPGIEADGEGGYDVYVEAIQFAYFPNDMRVPGNSTVTFHVTSSDVIHSFSVVGTNANTMVIPGEIASVTVETDDVDEPRKYGVICTEYCGSGHHDMEAALTIVPEDEFELEGEE